jgi:hypothetical protein
MRDLSIDDERIINHFILQAVIISPENKSEYIKSCWCQFYKKLGSSSRSLKFVYIDDDLYFCFDIESNKQINQLLTKIKKNNLFFRDIIIRGNGIVYSLNRDVNVDDVAKILLK